MAIGFLDFTQVDPSHLGSKEDQKRLIDRSKMQNIGTILDIVVNPHGGRDSASRRCLQLPGMFSKPYFAADGTVFDDREVYLR